MNPLGEMKKAVVGGKTVPLTAPPAGKSEAAVDVLGKTATRLGMATIGGHGFNYNIFSSCPSCFVVDENRGWGKTYDLPEIRTSCRDI